MVRLAGFVFVGSILVSLLSSAEALAQAKSCESTLLNVSTFLLHEEGFQKINECGGTGTTDNCQLEFLGCRSSAGRGPRVCYTQYTYGGGYPNYNSYQFEVGDQCEILSVKVERL